MAAPSFTPQQLGTAADWGSPQTAWQRLKAAHGGTLTPDQTTYVDQQIAAGTGAANPFLAMPGTGSTPGTTPAPATTLGNYDVSVPDAPAFPGSTQPMPTLGTVDAYAGPTSFTVPGVEGMYADPGYAWRRDEALKASDRAAAAHGTLRGGGQIRAQMDLAGNLASQEYGNVFNRALTTTQTNAGLAGDAYDRSRLERDARFGADIGNFGRGLEERKLAWQPSYDTWSARALANQRNAEIGFGNQYDRETFYANLGQRRDEVGANEAYRRDVYNRDDAWRRYLSEIQQEQFLSQLGNY